MSFELIIPFLRPIEPLLLDESISEIMGNPDSTTLSSPAVGLFLGHLLIEKNYDRLRNYLPARPLKAPSPVHSS